MSPLSVACAQPQSILGDLVGNVGRHVDAIGVAATGGADLVVFPELSLTGYDLRADLVQVDDPRLDDLVEACMRGGLTALVGAPVGDGRDRASISTVSVDGRGCAVAYRKMFPSADELARFVPGEAPSVIEIDRWRVGLAICRDTGVEAHAALTAAQGIDMYVASVVDRPEAASEQRRRAERIRERLGIPVAVASAAGSQGGGFDQTAGRSCIIDRDGTELAVAGDQVGQLATATVAP